MIESGLLSVGCWWSGGYMGRPSTGVWIEKSWRIMDGGGIERSSCGSEDIGRVFC